MVRAEAVHQVPLQVKTLAAEAIEPAVFPEVDVAGGVHLCQDLLHHAPVGRVATAEVPIPYAKHLEDAAVPQVPAIVAAAKATLGASGG